MAFQIILNERPTLAELQEHVRTNSWHALGVQLHLDCTSLDGIKHDNSNIEDQRMEMFSLFLKTNTQASRKLLLEAMKKKPVEEISMADDYEKYLRKLLSDGMYISTDKSICPLSHLYNSVYNYYISDG